MLRIGINGIAGRMGRELIAAVKASPELTIAGGAERPGSGVTGVDGIPVADDLPELLGRIDVLVDFTAPAASVAAARACAAAGVPLVSGTTGLSAADLAELDAAAARIPVFHARNMSVGISAVAAALPALVRALDGYDIEIVEAHHRHKVDAPSGTALVLAEAIAGAVDRPLAELASYGRQGHAPRVPGEIGIHAVRGGGNAGEHTVIIADEGEEIRIAHRAYGRRTFARGALRAARFIADRAPGRYGMADLLVAGG